MNVRSEDTFAIDAKVCPSGREPRGETLSHQTQLEGRWRGIFENSAIGIALADLEGKILSANAALQAILGYSEKELQLLTFWEITHEEDLPTNRTLIAELMEGRRQQFQMEKRYRRKDGQWIWASVNVSIVPGDAGAPSCLMAICEDITEREWAEAVLAGEKRVLEMIARGRDLDAILDELCQVAEGISSGFLCSILLMDAQGERLCHGAGPSLPKSYIERYNCTEIASLFGPCAVAAFRKEQVIVADVESDPQWERYRGAVEPYGVRACWSTPIISSEGKVLGTFAMLWRRACSPTPRDKKLIERLTHLASIAIERARGEEALRRSEAYLAAAKARFEGILEIAEDAIISIDATHRVVLFNQGAEKVFGYTAQELTGKPVDILLPRRFAAAHQGHIEAFAKSPEVSRSMGERREVFGRRKDGSEFPAEASISKLQLGSEIVFTVILRDITERKKVAEALRASAQLARSQAEALSRTLDALTMESAHDRLVEHVLRTIIGQLDAHSAGVWLGNQANGLVNFEFAFEDGKLFTKADAALAKISPTLKIEEFKPWAEVFRTGKPTLIEDIRESPPFPWREHVLSLGVVTILVVPMLVAGQVEGVIGIRFTCKRTFRAEETELAQALAHQAMLAIRLMHLSHQSRQAAVMAERNRMARDIHDTLAQGFTGVIVQLEAASDATSEGLVKEANEHIARASDLARGSLREARRSVQALRPQALEEKDLCGALEDLLRKMTAGTNLRTEFVLQGAPKPLPAPWGENLLRIGQEVLTNSLRHASATEFEVRLTFDQDQTHVSLRDNGRGFDPAGKHDGFGLLGIQERVESMNGRLGIQSGKGQGTMISITVPCTELVQENRL